MTLQAQGLTYFRGHRKLFSNLSLSVQPGEAVRIAGRNGSGKTSLLCLLAGLSEPQQGVVLWQGRPIKSQRDKFHQSISFVGHRAGLKDDLSAVENVRFSASLAGKRCTHQQARDALAQLGLVDRFHVPVKQLSQGQRRRVQLARLAVEPISPILILDEPFVALDRESVSVLSDWLIRQTELGVSIVYTTHQSHIAAARHQELQLGDLNRAPGV